MKKLKGTYGLLALTILGVIVFCIKAWIFANSHLSVGDEGSYLFKGYMFARGDYYPFQEYAFWTNKSPLAFVIPGYIQYWFGPGLREGRYFALFIALLLLLGMWLASYRLGGMGWAALTMWVFALSDAQTVVLSQAVSQGLVACMLIWMFVFVLGEDHPVWQLIAGSILSVLIIMTRQNMIVVPVLLAVYLFWQYGVKTGWLSIVTIALAFLFFYIYYGPLLIALWLDWVPNLLTPFDKVVISSTDVSTGIEATRSISRMQSFVTNIHDNFFVFVGSISALILWKPKRNWKNIFQYKTAIFLAAIYFSLFFMHVWASIFNDYCVWCMSAYQAFYNPAGMLFIIALLSKNQTASKAQRHLLTLFLLLIGAAVGIYYYFKWGGWLLQNVLVPLPGRLLRGQWNTVSLGDVFTYQFFIPSDVQDRLASALGGLVIGTIFLFLVWKLYRFLSIQKRLNGVSLTSAFLASSLFVGSVFPALLDAPLQNNNCGTDFLNSYETAGYTLADLIPPDTLVYWKGSGRQLALMLYMTDVNFFPPQIHAGGGDVTKRGSNLSNDALLKIGLFNKEIDSQWREQADFHIAWSEYFTKDMQVQAYFAQPLYQEIPYNMGELSQCEDPLFVFKKR